MCSSDLAIRDQPEKLIVALSREEVSEKRYNYFKTEFSPRDIFETAEIGRASCRERV